MRVMIMGAGGVGGYFGAHLAAAGHEVTFVARGAHLDAIRAHGFRLEGSRGDIVLKSVGATDDPATLGGAVDVVLFAVKLYDTEQAGEAVRPAVGPDTMVVNLQNGVDGPDRLAAVLGQGAVLGGAAYVSALIAEPGVVRYTSDMSRIVFGELDGTVSERAVTFRDACRAAGFDADVSADIRATLWDKFVLLATNAGLTTLLRKPAGEVYTDPEIMDLAQALMREVVAVAAAEVSVPRPTSSIVRSRCRGAFRRGCTRRCTTTSPAAVASRSPAYPAWSPGADGNSAYRSRTTPRSGAR